MVILKSQLYPLKEQSILIPVLQSIRNPLNALTNIHRSYGDLVLGSFFNKKLLFVCKPEDIEEVYAQEAKGLLSRDFLYDAKKSLFGDGLINSKGDIWANQRRIMQPIFTKEAIPEWEKVINEEAESAKNRLKNTLDAEVNISNILKILVQKTFIRILMGISVDNISNPEALIKSISNISKGLLPLMVAEIISNGKLMWFMPIKKRKYQEAVNQLTAFVNQEIARKYEQPGHDLISLLIQAKDKKSGYTMSEELLKDETVNLFFAGQDTTINTLAWFFYFIGKNDVVHKKITEEIRNYKDEPITLENLAKLTYTKACLHETLRLYPSSPALSSQATEDIMVGGQSIAKGTTIILSTYVTHRHEKLWERPNEFYPDHFLNQSETERHKYAFFPYGGGLHNCIGRHFVEMEMMIIIVSLLRAFTFKTEADVKVAASITLKPDRDIVGVMMPLNIG
ncbi:MAG: cytochrome P450 [Methylococcales bacterium]